MIDVTVVDFDHTTFKMHHGVIEPMIDYLKGHAVYVLTYRGEKQAQFIIDTLQAAGVDLVGVACCDSRAKDPMRKVEMMTGIQERYRVIEAWDDDERVLAHFAGMGINAHHPNKIIAQ